MNFAYSIRYLLTMQIRLAFILCLILGSVTACSRSLPVVKDGDIIFQTSKSLESMAVQHATHSHFSHMGIVFFRHGQPYVYEASATVRYTPLSKWIAHGRHRKFVIKRLRKGLTPAQVKRLHTAAREFAGKPYDLTFEWTDSRIYCSELVWKIYDRGLGIDIGQLQRLREFDLSDPVVSDKMQERYGNKIPLDEQVISPAAMFASPLLVRVK